MMISLLVDAVTAAIKTVDRICTATERKKTVVFPEHGLKFDPQRGWMTHD